jgi:hypothetical protein
VTLSEAELRRLEEAVEDFGAPITKGFLVFEAIEAGLANPANIKVHGHRTCRVYFWLPRRLNERLRIQAEASDVSMQYLIRHFLSQYLADPPWKSAKIDRVAQEVSEV